MSTKDAPDIIAEAITPYQRVKISGLHVEPNRREFFRPILTSFLEQWMQTEPVIYWSDEAGTEPGPPTGGVSSHATKTVSLDTLDSSIRWHLANGFRVRLSSETIALVRRHVDPNSSWTPGSTWLERRFDCRCSVVAGDDYILWLKMDVDEASGESDAAEDPPETFPETVSRPGDWVHQASGDLGQSIREAALISIAPASLPKDWSLEQLASFVVGASHAIDAEALRQAKDVEAEGGET